MSPKKTVTTKSISTKKSTKASPSKTTKAVVSKPKSGKPQPKILKPHKKVVAELVDESEIPTIDSDLHNEESTSATRSREDTDFDASTDVDVDGDPDADDGAITGSDAQKFSAKKNFLPSLVGDKTPATTTADPFAKYLSEVRKYPLLTKEQEQELANRYFETKDPLAAQALVTANLRFVVKVAAEYSKFGARMIDLVQEGNMGLMHAVRDFNPHKGVRLITYAVWWIRGYIQEYLMKQYSLVKIGTTHNQKKLFYQLQKQRRELESLGILPDMKLIAARLGVSEDEVSEMSQRISGRDVSLDQPADSDSGWNLKDFQRSSGESPDEELGRMEELARLRSRIESLKPSLNEREKILLEERLLADDPLTLQEIGEKYKITREAVRQAEARLMKKIRELYLQDEKV